MSSIAHFSRVVGYDRGAHYKGELWTDGYYISTVGQNVIEAAIKEYVKKQDQ